MNARLDTDWRAVAHAWRDASVGDGPTLASHVPEPEVRAARLAATPGGAEFLEALADEIVRFDCDAGVARSVGRLSAAIESGRLEASISWLDRVCLALGAGFAPLLPRVSAWFGRRVAWHHLGHLITATERLETVLTRLDDVGGIRPVVAPVHTRAVGHRHADLQLG